MGTTCGRRCPVGVWCIHFVTHVLCYHRQAGIRLPYAAGQPAEEHLQLQLQHALLQLGRGPAWDARGHSTEVRDLCAVRAPGQQRVRWTSVGD